MRTFIRWTLGFGALLWIALRARSQSLGNAGTIEGFVVDQSGAAIVRAEVNAHNAVSGYSRSVLSGPEGTFQLVNIPPSQYHLEITASGFSVFSQEVAIRNSLPVQIKAALVVASASTSLNVDGTADAAARGLQLRRDRSLLQHDFCDAHGNTAGPLSLLDPQRLRQARLPSQPGPARRHRNQQLRHSEGTTRITASVAINNLTNKIALYNFLSTLSRTHFLQPRTVIGHIGLAF